jgi:histone deacetylase 8
MLMPKDGESLTANGLNCNVRVGRAECAVVLSQELLRQSAKIPKIGRRANMVQSLMLSYRLLDGMRLISPLKITNAELRAFHSEDYVEFLEQPDRFAEEDFGCGYDCPVIDGLAEFARVIAGASLAAAEVLVSGQARVAINWYGGWHHAKAKRKQVSNNRLYCKCRFS